MVNCSCCCLLFFKKSATIHKKTMKKILEREREEGQALLRSMITASEKIDWQAIIAKAEELHTREQELLQRHNRKERQAFVRKQRCQVKKRRNYDRIGSFSVNILTCRDDSHQSFTSRSVTSSIGSIQDEERSFGRSTASQQSSPEQILSETSSSAMDVIDDQLESDSD
mmetsp:Transcript_27629/g.41816  ORF Transcript_27629/g.41816 Transcript_27629/m.41816 type:complete len:169 (-) Transcript_27629:1005-1511(-)